MRKTGLLVFLVPLALTACTDLDTTATAATTPTGHLVELPEQVLALAAPFQDLSAVKIDPTDGCYVYRHVGPVETTYLPLRSTAGRPICTREQPDPIITQS